MTFRTGKKHKIQETGKSGRNVLKLASRFQRFLNTGKSSKKDLKEIDDLFSAAIFDQSSTVLQILDQLKDKIPKGPGKETVDRSFDTLDKVALDSKGERKSWVLQSQIDTGGRRNPEHFARGCD